MNVDDENLYLTNTGNWSETTNLEEKRGSGNNFSSRKLGIILFLAAAGVLFTLELFWHLLHSEIGILALISVPLAAYKLYSYFSKELGVQCRIPRKKLISIEITDSKATLSFLDLDNMESSVKLPQVDNKGLQILTELKDTLPESKKMGWTV